MQKTQKVQKVQKTQNILIVDDDVPFLETVQTCIDWESLPIQEVFSATSAEEAQEILSSKPVHILMTDIEMSVHSGLDLLRWVRDRQLPCVPIILSNCPDFAYAQEAISYGVFEYLLKTVDEQALADVIVRASRQSQRNRDRQPYPHEPAHVNAQIEKIQRYISEHLSEPLGRNEIAAYVGFAPEYLSSFFRKETGTTLVDYINQERLSLGQRLLLQTDLPISMIAQNIGFDSSSYFTMLFRKFSGMTPREYRKLLRG